jgi:hypothetical protein
MQICESNNEQSKASQHYILKETNNYIFHNLFFLIIPKDRNYYYLNQLT